MSIPDFDQASLIAFFSQYAYQPEIVYLFVVLVMLASSFGFPLPEEITLVSSGLVAYLAQNPAQFPPPYPGAQPVEVNTLMLVAFFAVFGSDLLVYLIGRFFGNKLMKSKFMLKHIEGKTFKMIDNWFKKYGSWCCGIFRFTPGIRFTGHLMCGILKVPLYTFVFVDGLAALVSVPTQIYFVATYGEVMLEKMQEFKIIIIIVLATLGVIWFVRKRIKARTSS
jgi:membrane protein DedA with SNARE-associated domain